MTVREWMMASSGLIGGSFVETPVRALTVLVLGGAGECVAGVVGGDGLVELDHSGSTGGASSPIR